MFADDVALLRERKSTTAGQSSVEEIQEDVNNCQKWAEDVGGEFSASKTQILTIYIYIYYFPFISGFPKGLSRPIKGVSKMSKREREGRKDSS